MRDKFIGMQVTRFFLCTPAGAEGSHFLKSYTKVFFSGVFFFSSRRRHTRWPTRSFVGRLRNSSSDKLNDTTGQFSEVSPAFANSLQNGTLVSPFNVLITQAFPPPENFLMAATMV